MSHRSVELGGAGRAQSPTLSMRCRQARPSPNQNVDGVQS
jgi:hypothetical protein